MVKFSDDLNVLLTDLTEHFENCFKNNLLSSLVLLECLFMFLYELVKLFIPELSFLIQHNQIVTKKTYDLIIIVFKHRLKNFKLIKNINKLFFLCIFYFKISSNYWYNIFASLHNLIVFLTINHFEINFDLAFNFIKLFFDKLSFNKLHEVIKSFVFEVD